MTIFVTSLRSLFCTFVSSIFFWFVPFALLFHPFFCVLFLPPKTTLIAVIAEVHSIAGEWRSFDRHYLSVSQFFCGTKVALIMPIQIGCLHTLCTGDTPLINKLKSIVLESISNVPMQCLDENWWPSMKRPHFLFLIEKPHFVWKWARLAATRRYS